MNDPFGDNDPLVKQALDELHHYLDNHPQRNQLIEAIDNLILARITVALDSLTDAALGNKRNNITKA